MACTVETRTGELIKAEVSYAGDYGARFRGYVQGYKEECKMSFTGSSLKIGSGCIVWDGKRIIIDDNGMTAQIPTEASSDKTYFAFNKIDMSTGAGTLEFSESATPPGFSQDDLFLNYTTGVHWIQMGTFVNSTTGIKSVNNTLKSMTGITSLFSGAASVGDSIDLKYPLDVLKAAKHIDLKLELLNIKLQGIVAYNNTSIYFSANYPTGTGSGAGSGIPMCELQLVSGTVWRVNRTLITYTNGAANVEGRKVERVEVQF